MVVGMIGGKGTKGGTEMIGGKGQVLSQAQKQEQNQVQKDAPVPVELKSLDGLFKTMHRMISALGDLNAEFQLRMPDGTLFWLVPSYTSAKVERNEISFNDAATVTIICASYGGTVVQFKFLGHEIGEI